MLWLGFLRVTRTALLEAAFAEQDFMLDVVQPALFDDEPYLFDDRVPVVPVDHAEQVVAPFR
jgi:hypothetical protein